MALPKHVVLQVRRWLRKWKEWPLLR